MFQDINKPEPEEIKYWMTQINLSISEASVELGISKRQFLRFLSGDTGAKKVHALAMQMLWVLHESNKDLVKKNKTGFKKIKIPIK